jgi:formate dehydrogenase subunit delta
MPVMKPDKLVMMANQIGRFFAAQPGEAAERDVALHLKKFWEPRMRDELVAYADGGGAGLEPVVRAAVEHLRPSA